MQEATLPASPLGTSWLPKLQYIELHSCSNHLIFRCLDLLGNTSHQDATGYLVPRQVKKATVSEALEMRSGCSPSPGLKVVIRCSAYANQTIVLTLISSHLITLHLKWGN